MMKTEQQMGGMVIMCPSSIRTSNEECQTEIAPSMQLNLVKEQETPMLDKSPTSGNMPAIGTPPRFTEFSVWKPSTRLNSNCTCAVVDHERHGSAVRHLSLTVVGHFACRACNNNKSEILKFLSSDYQKIVENEDFKGVKW